MASRMGSLATRLGDSVKGFSLAQKTIALIGLAAVVLGAFALGSWLTRPSYTPLFSGLQAADANSIIEQLQADGVPYEITAGGGTIMVPEANVYDQRLKAAGAGLPSTSSGGGYSLLDDMGVTSSEFQQSVTYKRALEGELASTIGALTGVRTASVQLALPEDTVFVSEQRDPTASVFVETENGVSLNADQVQAIVHLTSASIDGMPAENVAVIDASGNVLSAVGVGATGSGNQQAAEYEQRVVASVQAMLDRVAGPGNATVAVAADMSYESANRVEETFTTPENAPALNEATTTEEYTGAGGGNAAAGVLGPDNIAVPTAGDDDGSYTSESTTRNNAVNKVTETREIPAGALARQTVSVALNADAAANLNVADVRALVSSAAGINVERGDQLTVEMLSFNDAGAQAAQEALAAAEAAEAAAQRAELLRTGIMAAGIVLALIVALVAYALRSRRQNRQSVDLGELPELDPLAPATNLALIGASPATTAIEPPVDTAALRALTPPDTDVERKRAELDALAAQDPVRTADYLRNLMDETRV